MKQYFGAVIITLAAGEASSNTKFLSWRAIYWRHKKRAKCSHR